VKAVTIKLVFSLVWKLGVETVSGFSGARKTLRVARSQAFRHEDLLVAVVGVERVLLK